MGGGPGRVRSEWPQNAVFLVEENGVLFIAHALLYKTTL
jgi:hypothetical protein